MANIARCGSVLALMALLIGGVSAPFVSAQSLSVTVQGSVPIGSQPVRELAHTASRVYIAGSYAQSGLTVVDVVNPAAPSIVTTVASSGGAGANGGSNRYYTSFGFFSGQVRIYDGATDSIIATLSIGFCGGDFDVDETANRIFVMSQCGGLNDPVHVIDGATNTVLAGPLGSGGVASHVIVNPVTGNFYASNWRFSGSDLFTRVFNSSFAQIADYTGHTRAVDPITNKVYVETFSPNEVRVLDGTTHAQIGTIPGAGVNNLSVRFGLNENLQRLYIPDQTNGNVKVIDTAADTMLGTFTLGAGVTPLGYIDVDPIRNLIYVVGSDGGTNKLYVVKDNGSVTLEQSIQDLIDSVQALAPSMLSVGQANSLAAKLENALKSMGKGDAEAAQNQLEAFINQVNALMNSGMLTNVQGQALIDEAEEIRAEL